MAPFGRLSASGSPNCRQSCVDRAVRRGRQRCRPMSTRPRQRVPCNRAQGAWRRRRLVRRRRAVHVVARRREPSAPASPPCPRQAAPRRTRREPARPGLLYRVRRRFSASAISRTDGNGSPARREPESIAIKAAKTTCLTGDSPAWMETENGSINVHADLLPREQRLLHDLDEYVNHLDVQLLHTVRVTPSGCTDLHISDRSERRSTSPGEREHRHSV